MRGKLALVAIASGVAGVGAAASASAASPGITGAKTLHLVGFQNEQRFVEIGHSGAPKLGDEFVFHESLSDENGTWVGHDGVVCTVIDTRGQGETNCVGTFSLKGGQITLQGLSSGGSSPTSVVAVNGGTGDYQNARGEMVVHSTPNGKTSHYTLYLIP